MFGLAFLRIEVREGVSAVDHDGGVPPAVQGIHQNKECADPAQNCSPHRHGASLWEARGRPLELGTQQKRHYPGVRTRVPEVLRGGVGTVLTT